MVVKDFQLEAEQTIPVVAGGGGVKDVVQTHTMFDII